LSLRPRFAGDGRLRLPASVSIRSIERDGGLPGDVVGRHGESTWDPFERTAEGLLLAEDFARADLERPRRAQRWYQEHGIIDLVGLFPENEPDWRGDLGDDRFEDTAWEVLAQQDNVRWHLLTLARLSQERERAGRPRADRRPHDGWDPAWAQPAIWCPTEVIWLGATTHYEARILNDMQKYPTFEAAAAADSEVPDWSKEKEIVERWWPAAHASAQRLIAGGYPIIWMPWADYIGPWQHFEMDRNAPHGRLPSGSLHVDWHGLVDLQRRLLTSYVQRAAAHAVVLEQRGWGDPQSADASEPETNVGPVRVQQRRTWRSLLAPVYLQLFEGLRRVSEDHSGATWCRECHEPFLTLDARRSSFCNDRHRFRYAQRERRRRLAARPIGFTVAPRP